MYDSEYFKKVIGNNYNSKEIYSTYNNNENKIFPVNSNTTSNEASSNMVGVNTGLNNNMDVIKTSSEMSTQEVSNEQVTNKANDVFQRQANSEPTAMSYNNTPYPEDYYRNTNANINYQNIQETNTMYQQTQETNTVPEQFQEVNAMYQNVQDTSTKYPEIYNIVDPMVEEILNKNQDMEFTSGVVDTMAMEIYNAVEADTNSTPSIPVNSNGVYNGESVINANSRPRNSLLLDLIRILLLNHINRPRPPRPHPDRPPMRPPYPPRQNY